MRANRTWLACCRANAWRVDLGHSPSHHLLPSHRLDQHALFRSPLEQARPFSRTLHPAARRANRRTRDPEGEAPEEVQEGGGGVSAASDDPCDLTALKTSLDERLAVLEKRLAQVREGPTLLDIRRLKVENVVVAGEASKVESQEAVDAGLRGRRVEDDGDDVEQSHSGHGMGTSSTHELVPRQADLGDLALIVARPRGYRLLVNVEDHVTPIMQVLVRAANDLSIIPQLNPDNRHQIILGLPPPTLLSGKAVLASIDELVERTQRSITAEQGGMQKRLRALRTKKKALPDDLERAKKKLESMVATAKTRAKEIGEQRRKQLAAW